MLSNGGTNGGLLLGVPEHRLRAYCCRFERAESGHRYECGNLPTLAGNCHFAPVFRQWPELDEAGFRVGNGASRGTAVAHLAGAGWCEVSEVRPSAITFTAKRRIRRRRYVQAGRRFGCQPADANADRRAPAATHRLTE